MIQKIDFTKISKNFEKYISVNSEFAKDIGFTSDKFLGHLYMEHDKIYYIAESNNDYDIIKLFMTIESIGFTIIIQEPSNKIIEVGKARQMCCVNDGEHVEKVYSNPDSILKFSEKDDEIIEELLRIRWEFSDNIPIDKSSSQLPF